SSTRTTDNVVTLSPDVDWASAPSGPTGLLYLQQVIGNRTVQRLLVARQQGAAEGPLSAARVRDAIAYYRNKPDRYTRDIIMEIQKAVGTDPTGIISAVAVQPVPHPHHALHLPL